MMSPLRTNTVLRSTLSVGVVLLLGLSFGALAAGDEQEAARQANSLGLTDSQATPSESTIENKDPAEALAQLTDEELTVMARGGKPPEKFSGNLSVSRERMNELLLRELARRWEKAANAEAGPEATSDRPGQPGRQPQGPQNEISLPAKDTLPPREVIIESALTETIVGKPLGVGRLELTFVSGHGPIVYPDQPLFLRSPERRTHYATFDLEYQQAEDSSPFQVKRLDAFFLISDQGPLQLVLSSSQGELLNQQVEPALQDDSQHRLLMTRWWKSFSSVPEGLGVEQRQLKEAMLDVLARRHKLPSPWPRFQSKDAQKLEGLEAQFERAVGMLFGIESVKLAIQEDVTLGETSRVERADQPIPARPRLRGIQIPSFQAGWIEPIAMHVPEECFYLRTGNVANYRYFREFLTGWGGSLDDIVTSGSLDRQIRGKLEFQLGLDSEKIAVGDIDEMISDMALIGCDPLFQDGAAVGLLFCASDGRSLAEQIKVQRGQVRSLNSDVSERRVEIDKHSVSLLSTEDHRVRSFYAIDGQYHLVTNSEYLLKRFFEAGRGVRCLGKLREFAYARSKVASTQDPLAFLYLSDPFFQQLVSPRYRIEMTRRAHALRELQQLQLARLVARAEHFEARSVNDLIEASLLPASFAKRADGSRPVFVNGQYQDSLRGLPGTFLPVPDVPLGKATYTEVSSYQRFLADYNRQWRRVDPVTVVLSRDGEANLAGLEQIHLEIIVTPYARERYALLSNHLADPSRVQLSPDANDLLSVQAAVQLGRGYPPHLVSIGLRDHDVAFEMEDGRIRLRDEEDETTFAKSRAYLALTPGSTDVLKMLASVLLKGESPPPPSRSSLVFPRPNLFPPPTIQTSLPIAGQAFYYFAWAFANLPPGSLEGIKYARMVETRNDLTVFSMSGQLREDVLDSIVKQSTDTPHMVHMNMRALPGSKVEPYIQAYTYLQARHASAENSLLLNQFTEWFDLPSEHSRDTIESLLGAEVRCPLGGDYAMTESDEGRFWTSTAWDTETVFDVSEAPNTWRFPFLDWLQGLELQFDLDQSTLRAKIDLSIRHADVQQRDRTLVAMQMSGPEGLSSSRVNESSFNQSFDSNTFADSRDWILGVRVTRDDATMRVTRVYPNSPASRVGMQVGDLIERVNGQLSDSGEALVRLVEDAQRVGVAQIEINRQGIKRTLRIPLVE